MINDYKNLLHFTTVGISVAILVLVINVADIQVVKSQSTSSKKVQGILPSELQWQDNLSIDGIQTAFAIGNPANSEFYVLFNKVASKTILPAHNHPDDRLTTVISGTIYYGMGEKFDLANMKSYPEGSIIATPAGTPHYLGTKDKEATIQQTGIGPTEIEFLTLN